MVHNLKIAASKHPIKSVTVFKTSKAEIVRTFSLELEAGQNKVEINGLPSCIDTQSVRVSGLGEARLFDVVCRLGDPTAAQLDINSSDEVIRQLYVQRQALINEKHQREQQAEVLARYARTLSAEHIKPQQMIEFLRSFLEQGDEHREAIAELEEDIVEATRKITKETMKNLAKKGEAHGEVTIVIVAQEKAHVELKLTYIVGNATWEPTYELHATTENGKPSSSVALHYRARITQSTGEDWNNTTLTLSTVSSDGTKSIPNLLRHVVKVAPSFGGQANKLNNRFVRQQLFGQAQQQMQMQQQQQQQQQQHLPGQNQMQQQQQQLRQFMPNPFGFGQGTPAQPGQAQLPVPVPVGAPAFGNVAPAPAPAPFGQTTVGLGPFGSSPATQFGGTLFGQTLSSPAPPAMPLFSSAPSVAGAVYNDAESGSTDDPEEDCFEEVVVPGPFAGPTTVVSETPLAISYSVEGESTIPTDGVAHQVSIAVLPFEARITHVAIPRVDAQVYLQCEVKNTSDYRLLPGSVIVILDDSYVSKTCIPDINKGDTFDCTLGADAATRVTYARSSYSAVTNTGHFVEAVRLTTVTSVITIHNKHQFAIADLVVRDAIPVSGDGRIKVILKRPTALADAKDGQLLTLQDGLKVRWGELLDGKGGEKTGKFDWVWAIDAGQKVKLELEYEVKAPADLAWVDAIDR